MDINKDPNKDAICYHGHELYVYSKMCVNKHKFALIFVLVLFAIQKPKKRS